jgi:hypothetical protein
MMVLCAVSGAKAARIKTLPLRENRSIVARRTIDDLALRGAVARITVTDVPREPDIELWRQRAFPR